VETLGAPAVDLSQQLSGFAALALALPPPTQAHHSPQLQRFGLPAAGHIDGPTEILIRRRYLINIPRWPPFPRFQQQLALEPVQLCLPETFPSSLQRCVPD
jgi:hypothetical protein